MNTKFMTWTLHAPSGTTFSTWKDLVAGSHWYDNNWIDINPAAKDSWDYRKKGFVDQFLTNSKKIYAIGMHELTLDGSGNVLDMRNNTKVLNSAENDLDYPVTRSLRWLMWNYPNIKWSLQVLCTKTLVESYLDNPSLVDEFLRQYKLILQIYLSHGFPIKGAEIDFEKTTTRNGDWTKFANLLTRVKNEVCIPLGLELRVNLFAMTGDFTPSYYAWHDYKTIASARDMNNNQTIDEFQLMTYDFSWGGSAPGPSTPIWWLTNVLKHVKDSLPPEKTFIGNAGYGRRWPLYKQKYGSTLDYKQLALLQNGMYIHNDGDSSPDGNFYFADQDYIPFCGFNDDESSYQVAFPHVYDSFKAQHGRVENYEGLKSLVTSSDGSYVTSYSTDQHKIFNGLRNVLNTGTLAGFTQDMGYVATLSEGLPQAYNFSFYQINKKRWVYDSASGSCILDSGNFGVDGSYTFNFSLPVGSYRIVAFVGFPFFGNDYFDIEVNGVTYTIGGNIPEWYPFITNPAVHLFDCGQWNLNADNTIVVRQTNGAMIGGFIICDSFNPDIRGGIIDFDANLQVMKKRGAEDVNGVSAIVDSKFPTQMTITGEMLRRPPRPAIIWEDMFGPYLLGNGFTESTNLVNFLFYKQADEFSYKAGSGTTQLTVGGTTYCTANGYESIGFSQGTWNVIGATANDYAHAHCDTTKGGPTSAQLVLNKKFSCNISCEAELQMVQDKQCRIGLRLLAQHVGEVGDSYLFLLDWIDNTVKLMHEVQGIADVLYSTPMSESLKSLKFSRITMKAQLIGDKLTCYIGNTLYLDKYQLPYQKGAGAFGIYMSYTELKVYRLTIATLDRYEPLETVTLNIDGNNYQFGFVPRTAGYDEYGLITYTGYPGNLTEAVGSIPSNPDVIDPSTVPGRVGTIFETEITPESWSLDYKNLQIATVPSWVGKKTIKLIMNNPGIWLRHLYVGDQQGYSVSYNADKIAFIKTVDMVRNYGCAGIAMWTLGQEDPMVFEYIENL